ncbi:BMC domain-containing protein [Alkaliphilus peptidifermentans]|uniref:Carboxysome shell and ethanolamine utilization microcompartment protein CcmL/EutN n=1 Tax=Alkaliphilus peptidifermentans DSM 18978 TaxID=1120976 RepID=A0A1G5AAS2_9FIRM|nr:BMC domain-containing protein [Alkaliphilus peptidifermentans]SCX74963.1 Carboxysome shell and ethanolamine utilization microcompartment protein CcmL/EutN [Alkaliphilus peptidifermentans DSM 18978]
MKKSIGLLEYKSIAKGMESADAMLKASNVELILSTPICPGKYISLISGDVGAVKNAVEVGRTVGGIFTVDHYVLSNVSEAVFPALTATMDIDKITSLGIIETMSAITSIVVGDIAAKSANIQLLEIRLARGLGGKGFVLITGEVAAVKSAIKACENNLEDTGGIISAVAIASPNREFISKIL